jgi:uncharacterized SAM-binding protein YcdF (DUF218 family)
MGAAIVLTILAVLPVGDWLLWPLETRFAPFKPDGAPVMGIIVLGGAVSFHDAPGAPRAQPNEAFDRVIAAARLARAFPESRVLVSGGPLDPITQTAEADFVAGYLTELGVDPSRLTVERRSRNTFENAQFSRRLAGASATQRWLLVTSAFHMPRAMACFRRAGFNVAAAPVDWRRSGGRAEAWSSTSALEKVDLAVREYGGLLVYRALGRTSTLFPAPGAAAGVRNLDALRTQLSAGWRRQLSAGLVG